MSTSECQWQWLERFDALQRPQFSPGKTAGLIIILQILLWNPEDITQFHQIMKAMVWLNDWPYCSVIQMKYFKQWDKTTLLQKNNSEVLLPIVLSSFKSVIFSSVWQFIAKEI